jgi:hypothetical protein
LRRRQSKNQPRRDHCKRFSKNKNFRSGGIARASGYRMKRLDLVLWRTGVAKAVVGVAEGVEAEREAAQPNPHMMVVLWRKGQLSGGRASSRKGAGHRTLGPTKAECEGSNE